MDKNWTRNPSLQNIDPAKIEMLLKLTEQGKGKSQKDLLPFLMAIAGQSKKNGMSFSPQETDADSATSLSISICSLEGGTR